MFLLMNILRYSEHCPKLILIFTWVMPHSPSVCADIPPSMPMGKQQDDYNQHLHKQLL